MLTSKQQADWDAEIAIVTQSNGRVQEYPYQPGEWGNTALAVNAELTELRRLVEQLRRARHEDAAHTGKLARVLTTAREALARYANPRIVADYTGDEWERVTSPDTARQAVTAIDTALGSKGESNGDAILS